MQDRDLLARLGYRYAEPLGAGVEGSTYTLGGGLGDGFGEGLVGKVWYAAGAEEVGRKQAFYHELAAAGLPFETPRYERVLEVDGVTVSLEWRLPGITLKAALESGRIPLVQAYDVQVEIVRSLANTNAGPATAQLRVMDELDPFRRKGEAWPQALARLVRERAGRFRPLLREHVDGYDAKVERVEAGLLARTDEQNRFVHGDLVPDNILVDERTGRLLAVLDWSFFTVAGDNAFEASVAAAIFDMYGPSARAHDDALMKKFQAEQGYPGATMRLYRIAYALTTACAFGVDGSDGHFAWCVRMLDRADLWDW